MDYVGNSEEPAHQSHEYASTSRLHVVFACDGLLTTWSKIQRCAGRPKDTPGNVVASCILFACSDALGPDSEHRRAVQVEMIVHSKQWRRFRRETLLGWLGESVHPEVEHLEAESIHPGRNKPFTLHVTIKQFCAETTREEPLNGKRNLEIYLASGEDVVGKAGRLAQCRRGLSGRRRGAGGLQRAILWLVI